MGLRNMPACEEKSVTKSGNNDIQIGEHVAVLKNKFGEVIWMLGIVESCVNDHKICVAEMVSKDRIKWTFPKSAKMTDFEHEHVICWNIGVRGIAKQQI